MTYFTGACFYTINSGKWGGEGGGVVLFSSANYCKICIIYRSIPFPQEVVGTFTITIALRTEILDAEFYSVGHSHCRNLAMPGCSDSS